MASFSEGKANFKSKNVVSCKRFIKLFWAFGDRIKSCLGTIVLPLCSDNDCNVIVAHNHPSGNTQLSDADRSITKKIKEAGKFIMDIPLLDHLIMVPHEGFMSFADEGYL